MSRQIAFVHPGEILLKDWLEPMGLSQYALAKAYWLKPIGSSQSLSKISPG